MATKKTSQEIARELLRERNKARNEATNQNRVDQLRKGLNNMAAEASSDKQKINSLLSDYETEYSKNVDSYNKRFTNGSGYRGDASGALRVATESNNKLTNIESEARKLLDKWGDKLGKDYVSSVNDFFTSASKTSKDILDTYTTDFNYMRTFKDEKEYNSVIEEQKKRQEENEKRVAELKAYSLEENEAELKKMQGYLSRVENGSFGKKDLQMFGYANEQSLRNAIRDKTDEINNYKVDSKKYGINDNKSPLSLSFPNREKIDKLASLSPDAVPRTTLTPPENLYFSNDKYKNILGRAYSEKQRGKDYNFADGEAVALQEGFYEANPQVKFETFATEEEKQFYKELVEEEGYGVANAYRASIDNELNDRLTKAIYATKYEDSGYLKAVQSAQSGFTGAVENMALYVDSAIKTAKGKPIDIDVDLDQLQFSVNAQNSRGIDKFVLEAINTTAAQTPAILSGMFVPVVGGALGSASFFGSAAGGALREAKAKGYTDEQAMAYANLIGASEVVLEKFLGAVPGVSKLSGKISKLVSGLDNAVAKLALQAGTGALSEFTEEALQTVIEPALAMLVDGGEYDAPTWEEILYSGLLGAVTGAGFGAATVALTPTTNTVGSATESPTPYQAVEPTTTASNIVGEQTPTQTTDRVKTASQSALDSALNSKNLTEESKAQAKTMFRDLDGVDPNSEEAIAHAENFVEDFETAVMAGRVSQETGETIPDLVNDGYVTTLTKEQTKAAIDSGRIEALESPQKKTISAEQKVKNINKMGSRTVEQINAESKADTTLTPVQKTAVKIAEKLNTALGFYNSADLFNEQRDGIKVKNIEGKKVLFLDRNTTDPVRQVFVHELAHFSENTKNYTKVAKAIMKSKALDQWLTQKGFEGKSLLEKMSAYRLDKKTQYQEYGENLKFEEANAEMIANFLGETFGTEEAFDNFMSELNTQDKRTVIDYLKDVVAWLKSTFKGDIPSELKYIERMYQKALGESAKDNKTVSVQEEVKMANDGIIVDDGNNVAWSLPYSFANIKNSEERKAKTEEYAKALREATGRSIEDCRKWIENETSLAAEIMTDPEMLAVASYEADDRYEAIKTNSDYPQGTVDMSNLCPKRSVYTWLVDKLQNKYPNKIFNAETLAKIRGVLDSESIQVACALCYVEDRRQLVGEVADTYINMWKDAIKNNTALAKTNSNGERKVLKVSKNIASTYGDKLGVKQGDKITVTDRYIPNQYDLTTYEGFKKLQVVHPQIAMGYELYNNSRGQQAVRLIEGRAEYKRQILEWSDEKVKKINDLGGLRMFSFSDFEVAHLVDMVQIILDCSARGVKIQCYTKIPGFAKLVRNTGIKLNRSLIPKGPGFAVVNGKKVLVFDNVEGINTEDANFLDERDNANIGNVLVGINGEQIKLAMLDNNIDYIIPFHTNKSQKVLDTLGIGEWNNYKNSQHDKNKATGKAASSNINIYTEVIDAYNPQNKVEFVEAFLEVAKEKNIIPRFSEFLNTDKNGDYVYTEGYHKFIIDFKLFDREGNILPQQNIVPDLDPQFMRELIASEVEKNKDTSQYQDVFAKIDKEFGETQYSIPSETENAYMEAAKRGDTETAQKMVEESAKDAGAILDADGKPLKLYRGTKGGQTVFAKYKTHGGKIYTTDSIEVASGYGDGSGRTTELRNQVKGKSSVYALYGFADKILTIDADHGVWHKLKIPDELIKYSDGKITATNAEIADWAEQEGYNALRIDNVKDGSRESANEIIFFDENLVKSADAITQDNNGNIIPLSERFNTKSNDIRFSIPDRAKKLQQDFADGKITHAELVQEEARLMDEARENYGTIEEGENAVNKTRIPSAVEDSKRINRFVRTITETGSVDARTANALGEKLLLGELSHKVASDEEAISTAEKSINNGTAEESWNRTVNSINKMPSKNDLAIGERLLAEALNSSNSVKALTIASDLADAFTRAGQWVQAASLLKKMTGPGMLIHLQRTVNKLNADMTKRYGNKYPLLQISENLALELAEASTQEDVEVIAEEIMQDLADQSPVTFLDKWNAWRYLAMLGNPLTHFRNLIGNAVFMPATMMRYETAALLEQALPPEERTKSVKVDEKYMDFAKQDSKTKEARKMLNMSDKMTGESGIARKRKIFKPKWLNSLYELNSELLGREDAMFKTAYYKRALAGYLQAKNVDLETITEEQLKVARNYASEEAAKNTYNDISTIAKKLKAFEKMHPVANVLVNGIVPFKQTPINIVKRGVEYSPFGLLNSLVLGTRKLKKGDISASEFIDGLSAGGSGTATFLIGMLFAAIGAASGGLGDDDEDKFRKLAGEQEYALRIGGKTYTLDWAAPMCIPFFMGVEFVTSMRKSDPGFTLQALEDTFWKSLDPLINMSMLSGVESALSSLQGANESEKIGAVLNASALSYLGQLTPTIFGKFATVVDKYRRTNYVDKNIPVPAMLQKLYNSTIAKVPILSMKRTKYIDAWGREVSQGNVVERVAESFFSPGYMSTMDYTDVDLEILELYENTGDNGVFPDNAPKYFTVNKERVDLTAKEYETFAKAKGQYSFEYVREFFESDYNDQMSDAERVKVLKKLYEYATDKAKAEVSAYNVEESNKLAYKTDKEGKSVVEYYANNVLSERYEPKLYNDALESASIKDAEKLKTDIIAWKVKNGSTEKEAKSSLRSSVTSYWKPLYLEAYAAGNEADMNKIKEKLEQSGLYGTYRQLNSTLSDWEDAYEEEK